jgi:hypothetical protein
VQSYSGKWDVMLVRLLAIARSLAALLVLLVSALIFAGATPAPHPKAADFFKPKEQLESFEVYHVDAIYNHRITLQELISSMPARDYVRIRSDNYFAVDALYSGLDNTSINLNSPCDSTGPDVRWAIVLNYKDHTREAIGFDRIAYCLQVSSRQAPMPSTDGMVKFVDRTFGFMR